MEESVKYSAWSVGQDGQIIIGDDMKQEFVLSSLLKHCESIQVVRCCVEETALAAATPPGTLFKE